MHVDMHGMCLHLKKDGNLAGFLAFLFLSPLLLLFLSLLTFLMTFPSYSSSSSPSFFPSDTPSLSPRGHHGDARFFIPLTAHAASGASPSPQSLLLHVTRRVPAACYRIVFFFFILRISMLL